ncbi:MAG: aspartate aminotransferase family protein [Proteobacteria bacterium]|nr:aspartate aminotransferase family protein [Pseudomonadota bacterium]
MSDKLRSDPKRAYPYQAQYGALHAMPEKAMTRGEILDQVKDMSEREDHVWRNGQCSGTIYAGDDAHYDFLNQVYGRFSHVNALQRDMCPSQTRFEAEIIAMTADMLNGHAVARDTPGQEVCGVVGNGGTESIISALLAYRERGRERHGITAPEIIIPITAHAAFDKGAHYFGIKLVHAPIDPVTTLVDVDYVGRAINRNTIALVGSAGNYPYGTIDPIAELSDLALKHGIGLHVDGCLGGFILPWGERLGYDIPIFDFRLPGVTSISADTHKYGYGLKGTSVILYRDKTLRAGQFFSHPLWPGGMYSSPGIGGSRSGGLLAASWAAMVSLGVEGYMARAKAIFETAFAMQDAVKEIKQLRLLGSPTFCFSFTSDDFDIYHVNDHMKTRGWRFNGQQYPSALHMCVTGPQTRPGVTTRFRDDLGAAVAYAKQPNQPIPASGSFYGGEGARATSDGVDVAALRKQLVAALERNLEQPAVVE